MKDAGFLITSPVGSDGLFTGPPASPPVGQSKNRVGAIVGSVVGVAVVALVVFFTCLHLRRKRDSSERAGTGQPAMVGVEGGGGVTSHTDPVMSYYGPIESRMSTTAPWLIPSSPAPTDYSQLAKPLPVLLPGEHQYQQQQNSRDMSETSSVITRPPAYDPVRMQAISPPPPWLRTASTSSGAPLKRRTSTVPEETAEETGLAEWARTHRAQIPARLEAKLAAAGYVPTDDPNSIPEEEWLREYGVTKFELSRIRALYQKSAVA